jgi:hypothetical protein
VQEDLIWEKQQAGLVQAAKATLASHIGATGRASPDVDLADLATQAMEVTPSREDKVAIDTLRRTYIEQVNRLWLYAENVGITGKLMQAWLRSNRRNLAGVDRADYSAEATFAMRKAVVMFQGKGPLVSFAFMYVNEGLKRVRDTAQEFDRLPEGTNPTASMIDNVTPETVLVAKRHLIATGLVKEGA